MGISLNRRSDGMGILYTILDDVSLVLYSATQYIFSTFPLNTRCLLSHIDLAPASLRSQQGQAQASSRTIT